MPSNLGNAFQTPVTAVPQNAATNTGPRATSSLQNSALTPSLRFSANTPGNNRPWQPFGSTGTNPAGPSILASGEAKEPKEAKEPNDNFDPSYGQWELYGKPPSYPSPAAGSIRLYGYQGQVSFKPGDKSSFESAARKLLSLRLGERGVMVIGHIDSKSRRVLRSLEATLPLSMDHEVVHHLEEHAELKRDYVWFVHLPGEVTPTEWQPRPADFKFTHCMLSRVDGEGRGDVAYYEMPDRKVFFGAMMPGYEVPEMKPWPANQYMPFLRTAQGVLTGLPDTPGGHHSDVIITGRTTLSARFAKQWYGGLEIDHTLWNLMHPHINNDALITVEAIPLAHEDIIFYLAGSVNSKETLGYREYRRRRDTNDPYASVLPQIEQLTRAAFVPENTSTYRIWRGDDFFDSSVLYPSGSRRPVQWNRAHPIQAAQDRDAISHFIEDAVADGTGSCRFFVLQAVDRNNVCKIFAPGRTDRYDEFDVDSSDMGTFKSKVSTLYKGHSTIHYEPDKDSVLLEPQVASNVTDAWNSAPFLLRANAQNQELAMVRRLISAPTVRATVLKNDGADFVKQLQQRHSQDQEKWGPRYGEVSRFRQEMGLTPLHKPASAHVEPKPRLSSGENRQRPAPRPEHTRKDPRTETWSKQPSVFSREIYNPSIPINAPPAEQIMRTGGSRVPMVIKNVLTPTEQQKLQEDFWTVRGMMLDRINKCPYETCRFTYRMDEESKLLQHVEREHVGDKCPWCSVQLFAHWSDGQRSEHFRDKHADVFRRILKEASKPDAASSGTVRRATKALLPRSSSTAVSPFKIVERVGPSAGPLPKPSQPARANKKESEYRYCDRCGRDHQILTDKDERNHHDHRCVPLAEASGRCTFCETCGDFVWNSKEDASALAPYDEFPHRCRGTSHAKKPHCTKCGFSLKKLSDENIDRHRENCKGFSGDMGCFCPYCQASFVENDVKSSVQDIKYHVKSCGEKGATNLTPFDMYREDFWRDTELPSDALYLGEDAIRRLAMRQRSPHVPTRRLTYPLAWHDKPGPVPVQDPPAECTRMGCREPLFGLTPSEVLAHYENKHGEMPLKKCPLCQLSFQRPKEVREAQPELGEWEERRFQVAHMECHVHGLWDVLQSQGPMPSLTLQEPFYPGHSLWDPDNEKALDRRDKRCPHFDKCGAMVGFMNQKQWNQHMETAHGEQDFELVPNVDVAQMLSDARVDRMKQRMAEGKKPIPGAYNGPGEQPEKQRRPSSPSRSHQEDRRDDVAMTDAPAEPEKETGTGEGSVSNAGPKPSQPTEGDHGGPEANNQPKPSGPKKNNNSKTNKKPAKPKSKPKPKFKKKRTAGAAPKTVAKQSGKPSSSSATQVEYTPDDDMYCSRCFRKAPKTGGKLAKNDPDRQTQVNAHTDPHRSCRIQAQAGSIDYDENGDPVLPSRVGWIYRPSGNITFTQLRDSFTKTYPGLEKTMCPTDGNLARRTNGWQHDPNNESNEEYWGAAFPPEDDDEDEGIDNDDDDDAEGEYEDGGEEEDEEDEEKNEGEDEAEEHIENEGGVDQDYGEDANDSGTKDGADDDDDQTAGAPKDDDSDNDGDGDDDGHGGHGGRGGNGVNKQRTRRRQQWKGPGLPHDPSFRDDEETNEHSGDDLPVVTESESELSNSSKRKLGDVDGQPAQKADGGGARQSKRPRFTAGGGEEPTK
ncbi:hypothetical protein C8035_v010841 [Colletotrichum spinosum]|uniref:Uncharacterized protein n=1 Tax=Colletotrichum spinosum TaxID=1347390 RepID=A0A4R8Q7J2_9PEZI|nr:hypothetical protein C8035_v010841 [Colletotrichum spinosum]